MHMRGLPEGFSKPLYSTIPLGRSGRSRTPLRPEWCSEPRFRPPCSHPNGCWTGHASSERAAANARPERAPPAAATWVATALPPARIRQASTPARPHCYSSIPFVSALYILAHTHTVCRPR